MAGVRPQAYATVHFHTLMIYADGKLVAEIPRDQFPALIVGMAKALGDRNPVDMTKPME